MAVFFCLFFRGGGGVLAVARQHQLGGWHTQKCSASLWQLVSLFPLLESCLPISLLLWGYSIHPAAAVLWKGLFAADTKSKVLFNTLLI